MSKATSKHSASTSKRFWSRNNKCGLANGLFVIVIATLVLILTINKIQTFVTNNEFDSTNFSPQTFLSSLFSNTLKTNNIITIPKHTIPNIDNNNKNNNNHKKSSNNASANNFFWGTATASYQIEGAVTADGRKPSIWDVFCNVTNKVYNHESGAIADNSYYLYETDISLLVNLGVTHYRLSIAWPRILPDGKTINMDGIIHYQKIITLLKLNNIEPLVTLFHWDLPNIIHEETNGGWINSSIVNYFKLYADTVFKYLHSFEPVNINNNDKNNKLNTNKKASTIQVNYWTTFNEPWTVCINGYLQGQHAPGRCTNRTYCPFGGNSSTEPYLSAHNMLRSHAYAVEIFRNKKNNYDNNGIGKIGMNLNINYAYPASDSEQDKNASQRSLVWAGAWFGDPLYFGDYPQIMKDYVGDRLPTFTNEEKILLKGSTDFYALNHYTSGWVWNCNSTTSNSDLPFYTTSSSSSSGAPYPANEANWQSDQRACSSSVNPYNNTLIGEQAASSWLFVVPTGIYDMLNWVQTRYNTDVSKTDHGIYVTENGVDEPNENQNSIPDNVTLTDTFRVNFLDGYITNVMRAYYDGINVQGYFVWSLMDNFEWADGYNKRFGIHFVDYSSNNLTRYQKESAAWFSDYIKSHP